MNPSAQEAIENLLVQLQAEQAATASRQRAVLITDLEKALAWAKYHNL